MGLSTAAAALCASPDHFNTTFLIADVAMDKCYNSTTNATSLDHVCHEYWLTSAPNITAMAPSSVEDGTDVWVFKSKSELNSSLPISKPLLIDGPMSVCAFGIFGPYADLQRYLMSATVHYFAILGLRDRHFIDMDILPTLMYAFTGFIAIPCCGRRA
ncbi:hypothetical protein QQZ08_001739 [Neonectria magnoliae]|uniref:Uncharacterized protein n=1 Tax=Neonectria magnoliae TaxID=2732573 RepID=A0ABR1IDX9_9HYPO